MERAHAGMVTDAITCARGLRCGSTQRLHSPEFPGPRRWLHTELDTPWLHASERMAAKFF